MQSKTVLTLLGETCGISRANLGFSLLHGKGHCTIFSIRGMGLKILFVKYYKFKYINLQKYRLFNFYRFIIISKNIKLLTHLF